MSKYARLVSISIISLFMLFACDSNDDNDPLDELIGTWDITALTTTGCNDPNDNFPNDESEAIGCITEDGFEACFSLSYTFDGTGNITITRTSEITMLSSGQSQTETNSDVITFSVNGDELTLCFDGDCETANFTIIGTTLALNSTDTTNGCVNSLTGTKRP